MPTDRPKTFEYINQLRVIAAFGVVVGHVSIWVADTMTPLSIDWWVGSFGHFMNRWTAPVFVMVSGALLLDPSKDDAPIHFYKKRMRRILIPLIFWTSFFLLIRNYVDHEDLNPANIVKLILATNPYYHLWYLYMIPALYLVTPLLRMYVKRSSFKQRNYLVLVIFLLASGYSLLNALFWENQTSIFTRFIPYIGYYLCGYQIRCIEPKKIPIKYTVAAGIFCILYFVTGALVIELVLGSTKHGILFSSFSPPVILTAVAVFREVYYLYHHRIPARRISQVSAEHIAPTTLGIYILHPAALRVIVWTTERTGLAGTLRDKYIFSSFAIIIGASIFVFFLSNVIVTQMMKVPYLRRLVS